VTGVRVLDSSSITLAACAGGQKPPPITTPISKPVAVHNSKTERIDVKVEVLADNKSSDSSLQGAKTKFDSPGVKFATPGYMYMPKRGKKIVTEIIGDFEL